ncbi:lactose/L-arabinose transport system permease protein [Rathayibacter sp. PhB151]|uniref:carbohydrate ABC transporter permease n=1 Tax=Rathayibacter sp. PhB151 TaxID=2485189 RepID=UPI0010626D7A|nr:sugar ABC transporter permease [Rathayibacter sp. PhB151]TDX81301.1 lactose/L-arabinose transport system permease protein [Rathayibacter sp. PhB151]
MTGERRRSLTGWAFLLPAAVLIFLVSFLPMVQAFLLSLQTGRGANLSYAQPFWLNYERLLQDEIFRLTLQNTFIYLIIQVPVMLIMALVLANLLNTRNLKFKTFWRTAIFLPCAVSLVAYSLVFRTIFANDGFVNDVLMGIGLMDSPINWLGNPDTGRFVIILGLLWRWTGYNMVFYLAALQNVDYSSIEAARMDGANALQTFWHVTIPQLKPIILLTAIMSTNGTLQLFDESWALTRGGPAYTTMSMSHYLYEVSFLKNPNFGYASALSYVILILVAVLAFVQLKVGDKRD